MKTVFFDVDTQLDFILPAGSLYVPGAERIIPTWLELTRFAAANSIPLISTMDAHVEDDAEFRAWPPHCVVGTVGQQKPVSTLLPAAFVIPTTPVESAQLHSDAAAARQILLEKQHTDCFTNPNLKSLLAWLQADLYVVYGVVTEVCVQQAIEGLFALGGKVHLVTDAVKSLDQRKADRLFETVQAKGGLTTAGALTA